MKISYYIFGVVLLLSIACGSTQLKQSQNRDKIVDLVALSTQDLSEAQQGFRQLSDDFSAFVMFTSSDLQQKFRTIERENRDAQKHHQQIQYWTREINERFERFSRNWRDELNNYGNSELRAQSLNNLQQAQRQYQLFYQSMQSTDMQMELILDQYSNMLLFISQNMNQASLANLESDTSQLRQDTATLERQIEQAIREANDLTQVLENSEMDRQYY